jgi:radical SAM-linked protein
MVFALPLPVGVESVCELVDVRIDKEIATSDVKELLNEVLTKDLQVLDVYLPERKFADIAKAEYRIELTSVNASEELSAKINEFFAKEEILMTKHTKSGEKEINISKLIYNFSAKYCSECNKIIIDATLSAGTESLNPEFLMSALRQYGILPEASLTEEFYSMLRTRVLDTNGEEYR